MRPVRPSEAERSTRGRSRIATTGQMVVLFVMSIFVLTGITAVVVDISWYWANTLRVQRAADAAALAGVVWLPGAPGTAYSTARTEATKNGYTDGAAGVTVFPIQDSGNDRRLDVTISAPVDTFFMKIFGIQTIQAIRTSKADFILPVPMGSPEQWYGIGNYEVFSPGPPHTRGPAVPTNIAGPNNWTNGPDGRTNNSVYATTGNTTSMQGYRDFGLGVPGADTINGIQIRVDAKSTDSVGCRLGVSLSWDNGTTWSSERFVDLTNNDPTSPFLVAGGPTTLWAGHTWVPADFSDANFRVRVRADNAGADEPPASNCRSGATTSLDFFDVTVYSTGPGTSAATNVPTPGGEALAPTSQGFWGAIFTRGGVRRNGDRYSPEHFDPGVPNAEYLPQGYDYTIEFGSAGGRVNLFDPVFCATGANASGSWYGAGDHWTTQSSSNSTPDPGGPVTTVFTLYDEGNTPYDPSDDVAVARLVEGNQRQADQSGRVGSQNAGRAALPDCSADPHHNQWVRQDAWTTPGPSSLPAGRYRLNVDTSQGANVDTGAENMWSIYVGDSGPAGSARVYGGGGWSATTTSRRPRAISASTSPRSKRSMPARRWSSSCSTRATSARTPGSGSSARTTTSTAMRPSTTPRMRSASTVGATAVPPRAEPRSRRMERLRQLVRQLGDHPRDPPSVELRPERPEPARRRDRRRGLVADRVPGRGRQRHHDLAGQHPRQPGPPRHPLIAA